MSLDGLLLIDKPEGITSHDVVAQVRKILNQKSVGHTGTLDPVATGLMVLVLGKATKLSNYLLNGDKGYTVDIQLGLSTDTFDVTGSVIENKPVNLSTEFLSKLADSMVGDLELEVPVFSSVKIKGKKLYQYARSHQEVELPKRNMNFYDLKVLEVEPNRMKIETRCSKGSYIRAWTNEFGKKSGVGASVKTLRRTYSAPFVLEDALTLSRLEKTVCDESSEHLIKKLATSFIPLSQALPHWKAITVGGKEAQLLSNGQIPYKISQRLVFELKKATQTDCGVGIRILNGQTGELLTLLEARPRSGLKILRTFANQS